ncbi:hypothetical protein GGI1_05620 [Acidithiobacillus sp. GGI-221]|nr:hypothetical protein GGI1_05620 [Acidithiobacillus sp. GGI-221]
MPDAGWAIASFSGHQSSHFLQFVVPGCRLHLNGRISGGAASQ